MNRVSYGAYAPSVRHQRSTRSTPTRIRCWPIIPVHPSFPVSLLPHSSVVLYLPTFPRVTGIASGNLLPAPPLNLGRLPFNLLCHAGVPPPPPPHAWRCLRRKRSNFDIPFSRITPAFACGGITDARVAISGFIPHGRFLDCEYERMRLY